MGQSSTFLPQMWSLFTKASRSAFNKDMLPVNPDGRRLTRRLLWHLPVSPFKMFINHINYCVWGSCTLNTWCVPCAQFQGTSFFAQIFQSGTKWTEGQTDRQARRQEGTCTKPDCGCKNERLNHQLSFRSLTSEWICFHCWVLPTLK